MHQTRINRGTFGAKLNNSLESSEGGMMFRGVMYEVMFGNCEAGRLHELVNSGRIPFEVFTAITAEQVKPPNERSLLYAVRALRDRLDCGAIAWLHRCDTRDMLRDALTKGSICSRPMVHENCGSSSQLEIPRIEGFCT